MSCNEFVDGMFVFMSDRLVLVMLELVVCTSLELFELF
jgi:hypothetical protein